MSLARLRGASTPMRPASFTTDLFHFLYKDARQPSRQSLLRPRALHTPARIPRYRAQHQTKAQAQAQLRHRSIRHNSTQPPRPNPDPTPHLNSPPHKPAQSLSQRLKQLSKEYGWTAFGVYMALSALDFPFCFLAVRLAGTDRIAAIEHAVVGTFKKYLLDPVKGAVGIETEGQISREGKSVEEVVEEKKAVGWGVEEAQEKVDGGDASLWTQLVLAYAIHKSFIFIRVPLTAAILPRVVRTLRGWGWKIGKAKPKGV